MDPSYGFIESVAPGGLTLKAPGVTAYQGGRIYPLIDAEISLEPGEMEFQGSRIALLQVSAREVAGPSALPGLSRLGAASSYRGIPILTPPIDWETAPSMALLRAGESFESGLVQVVFPRGARARMAFTLNLLGLSRARIWPTLKLFDGRKGRARRVFTINPGTLMDVTSVGKDFVKVGVVNRFDNLASIQANVRYLGVIYTDGTADVREILNVATAASALPQYNSEWTFALAEQLAGKAVQRVSFANFGRFEKDFIEEQWISTEVCSTQLSFLEVPE